MKRTTTASEEIEDLHTQEGSSKGSLSLEELFQGSDVSPSADQEEISHEEDDDDEEEEPVVPKETPSSQFLKTLWSQDAYAHRLCGREVTVVCDGHAYLLKTEDGYTIIKTELPLLQSSIEETDSRLGDSWNVPSYLVDELGAFTRALCGRPGIKHVDELRYLQLNDYGCKELDKPQNMDMSKGQPRDNNDDDDDEEDNDDDDEEDNDDDDDEG
ncbi:uncharacterized protein LOC135224792 [Macrobrachium nipponense]|uniref:uncharacterized protein LOC135224792 n=1 Tax=Macrobrachium nipponense TaxID=159736 RepID=UPI0030C80548